MRDVIEILQAGFTAESAITALVFFAAALLTVGIAGTIRRRDPVSRRMTSGRNASMPSERIALRVDDSMPSMMKILEPIEKKLVPKSGEDLSALQQRLARAGFHHPKGPIIYYATRLVLACGVLPAALIVFPILGLQLQPEKMVISGVLVAGLGFYLPALWVSRRIARRQREIRAGLADAIDMLLVCLEAGLSLGAALDRVSQEIGRAHPVLADELLDVSLAIQAGKSREEALRDFAARTGLDEVRSLVTMLVQTEALGTSIAQGLRVHADDLRKKRFLRAEERANKLPVIMALPLGAFIMPCLLLVIMTPVIIRVLRILFPATGYS